MLILFPLAKPIRMAKMTIPAVVCPKGSHTAKHAMTDTRTDMIFELNGPILSAHHPGSVRPKNDAAFKIVRTSKLNS